MKLVLIVALFKKKKKVEKTIYFEFFQTDA